MGWVEHAIINATKKKLNKALNLRDVREISSEGLEEHRDISYKNRSGKELLMDVFSPVVEAGTELPVIINIHGGGLIDGNKNLFGNKGVEHYLRHMGRDPKLIHAFPVLRPDLPESERVIDEIISWFKLHTGKRP